MNLDVNGEIIAEPKAGDISRAVDGRTDDISWYLVLTRPDGFYLELLPVEDGLFKLASGNEAQKLRQRSEDTIDPAKAKEVLQNFLIGGASWRALMPRGPGPERATQPTKTGMDTYSGRQMGWIAAVIGIGGAAYLFQLMNPLYVLIFMYGSIVGLMILFKSSQEIEVRRRPKAAGSVTKSALQYRRQRFERERTRLDNAPDVEYRFQVGGEAYLGARVGLNTEYASENVAEIVRRYPVGSIVQVAYNPKDPTDCLLEPGANTAMFRQILLLAAIPTGLALAVVYTTPRVQPWLLDRYPQAHPLHVVIAAVLAPYMTPMYLRSLLIGPPRSAPWAETPGKVVFAEVEAVVGENQAGSGLMILEPNYEPDVEIGYSVGGYDYRYRRQIPDFVPAAGQARSRLHGVAKSLAFINAEQALAAWPVGRDVAISYDTGNPGRAVLAGTQPTMQSPHRFGRIVLPPIAIAGVLAWGLWALRIY